jgi:hypothetical protein
MRVVNIAGRYTRDAGRRRQRDLVAASLLRLPVESVRWDEPTRTEYLVRT